MITYGHDSVIIDTNAEYYEIDVSRLHALAEQGFQSLYNGLADGKSSLKVSFTDGDLVVYFSYNHHIVHIKAYYRGIRFLNLDYYTIKHPLAIIDEYFGKYINKFRFIYRLIYPGLR